MTQRVAAVDDQGRFFGEVAEQLAARYVAAAVVIGAGIDPAGGTDSTTAIQAILDSAAAGSTVHFPAGEYKLSTALDVTKALTISGYGARLVQTGTGEPGIEVTASDVIVAGLRLTGRQFAAHVAGERAVYVHGASAAAYIKNVKVVDCVIDGWGQGGVWSQFVDGVEDRGNVIRDISYAGMMYLSCRNGEVSKNKVSNVTAPQAYGIAISHGEASLATDPRSADFVVAGNLVQDVTNWEGIDTHSGERVTIVDNMVLRCKTGIAVVGTAMADTNQYAAKDVHVIGNTIDSGSASGSGGNGIAFVGANAAIGTTIDAATGSIVGNIVTRMGSDVAGFGGIVFYDTQNLVVASNTIKEPCPNGIVVYHDNYGFTVIGNMIQDAWSETQARGDAIRVRSNYNKGVFTGNGTNRGTKTAAHVMDVGIEMQSTDASNEVMLGSNDWRGATTTVLDTISKAVVDGAHVTVGRSGRNLGFFGTTPIAKRAALVQTYATADRTLGAYTPDPESSAYTGNPASLSLAPTLVELNQLRVAYENLRLFVEDLAQHHNAVVDDLQAYGLVP